MLLFDEVLNFARQYKLPINNRQAILTEYLQCEILDSLFETAPNLHFIGGTSLRLLHNLPRFSEDLDFDNFDLPPENFKTIINRLIESLRLKGFEVEFRLSFKAAYHCYFKFNKLLYENKLSPYREQKILIRLDTTRQKFKVKREMSWLNRYGVNRQIMTNPLETIMAQKILAMLERKTAKGRDFYDFMWLQGRVEPDFDYLYQAAGIKGWADIQRKAKPRLDGINFNPLARETKKFLFLAKDTDKIINFKKYFDLIIREKSR